MSSPADIRIRPAAEGDLEQVADIEQNAIADPWSIRSFRETLERGEALFLVAERADAPDRLPDGPGTAEAGCGRKLPEHEHAHWHVAGYCVIYVAADEGELVTIAVDEVCRRRGIASRLLDAATASACVRGAARLYLEVRVSNGAAITFYEKEGFVRDGVRPGFYEHPAEDALIMHRELTGM